LVKNSEIEISRCLDAIEAASSRCRGACARAAAGCADSRDLGFDLGFDCGALVFRAAGRGSCSGEDRPVSTAPPARVSNSDACLERPRGVPVFGIRPPRRACEAAGGNCSGSRMRRRSSPRGRARRGARRCARGCPPASRRPRVSRRKRALEAQSRARRPWRGGCSRCRPRWGPRSRPPTSRNGTRGVGGCLPPGGGRSLSRRRLRPAARSWPV